MRTSYSADDRIDHSSEKALVNGDFTRTSLRISSEMRQVADMIG